MIFLLHPPREWSYEEGCSEDDPLQICSDQGKWIFKLKKCNKGRTLAPLALVFALALAPLALAFALALPLPPVLDTFFDIF